MIGSAWRHAANVVLVASLTAVCAKAQEGGGLRRDRSGAKEAEAEAVRPKVNKQYLDRYQARKDPAVQAIVKLHGEIQANYDELAKLKAKLGDPKEGSNAAREVRAIEPRIERDRRKIEKLVADYLKPFQKAYDENKGKYDMNKSRAAKLEEQGLDKRAVSFHQDAGKFTGAMESAKREIDLTRWHLFFETGETP